MKVSNGQSNPVVDTVLADLISEALCWAPDRIGRAEVLVQLVASAIEALDWRLAADDARDERASAEQLIQAALAHRDRMVADLGVD